MNKYQKHDWDNGELLTEAKLDAIENGIFDVSEEVRDAAIGTGTAEEIGSLGYRLNNMITVANSQPTAKENEIWVDSGSTEEVVVPTYDELETVAKDLAEEFSESKSYAVGDYCIHDLKLYRFIKEHTANTWINSDVTQVTINQEIDDLKNTVGENEIQFKAEVQSTIAAALDTEVYTAIRDFAKEEEEEEDLSWSNGRKQYATGSFFGWGTDFPAGDGRVFSALQLGLYKLTDDITKIRVQIGYGSRGDYGNVLLDEIYDATFPDDAVSDSNLPSEIIIHLGQKVYIEAGRPFYIAFAADKPIGTYMAADSTCYSYYTLNLARNYSQYFSGSSGNKISIKTLKIKWNLNLVEKLNLQNVVKKTYDLFPVTAETWKYEGRTFTGFSKYIGAPQNFNAVVFRVKNENDENTITKGRVIIAKLNKRGETVIDVQADVVIPPLTTKEILFPLGTTIANDDAEGLYCGYILNGNFAPWCGITEPTYPDEDAQGGWCASAMSTIQLSKFITNLGTTAPVLYAAFIEEEKSLNDSERIEITKIIKRTIEDISLESFAAPRVVIPDAWHAVVGDTLQLFYRGYIESPYPWVYNIEFICNIGQNTPRYYEVTPTAEQIGDHTVTIRVRDAHDKILAEAKSKITVDAVGSSPSNEKNVLCIGDSLTSGGAWPEELRRRLITADGAPEGNGLTNITFIGTVRRNQTLYEGYGGWTWGSYLLPPDGTKLDMWVYGTHDKDITDQHSLWKDTNGAIWSMETIETSRIKFTRYQSHTSPMPIGSGTLTHYQNATHTANISYTSTAYGSGNPFWNAETGTVDFENYCSQHGWSGIDYVITLLSWNALAGYQNSNAPGLIATHVTNAKRLLSRLHEQYPNAKVKMMGIPLPSVNGGTGQSYGANSVYSNWYGLVRTVMSMNIAYQEMANEDDYKDWIEFVNVSGQFDADYNMPYKVKAVNTRDSENTELVGTNGVHPSMNGYMQIADAAYRALIPEITG